MIKLFIVVILAFLLDLAISVGLGKFIKKKWIEFNKNKK
jgi:hypothetical protein